MKQIFHNDWQEILEPELEKPYYQKLRTYLISEYRSRKIFPPMDQIYSAFHKTAYQDVKVLILGQDPYFNDKQANGLAFSVSKEVEIPPSLVNIYKELEDDLGIAPADHGDLSAWADQGVLLLNAVLTVRAYQAASHRGVGWEEFTTEVIRKLNQREKPLVFILWGNDARRKKSLITNRQHLILESPHPSPLSSYRGFFGSKPFSKTNDFLKKHGQTQIDWVIR
ncbi:uracil-DNA glycosylase [Clostridiales bacterium COT073_COT-073]|nr:uracil-DNA glycosylase [Clostridiales bacterium COT073_COT-073]